MASIPSRSATLPLPLEDGRATPAPSPPNRPVADATESAASSTPPAKERLSPASLETAFTQLLGRKATPQELAELHRVRNVLNLQDNDALWLILLALDYYRHEIENAVLSSLKQAHATAKTTVAQAGQDYLNQVFPKLLAQATDHATAKALGLNGSTLITGVIVLITLVIVGMGGSALFAYNLGEHAGQQQCLLDPSKTAPPQPRRTLPRPRQN